MALPLAMVFGALGAARDRDKRLAILVTILSFAAIVWTVTTGIAPQCP